MPTPGQPTHRDLPLYSSGHAPPFLFTNTQLENIELRPGAPVRAYVESNHGPAALYLVTEARLIDPERFPLPDA